MSLINDALKRAKDAQQDAPAPVHSGPPLRPIETEMLVRHGVGLGIPILLALVALLILFFVWQYAPRRNTTGETSVAATEAQVRARTLPEQSAVESAKPTSLPVAEQNTPQSPTAKITPTESTASSQAPQPGAPSPAAAKVETNTATSDTNSGVVVPQEPPKPALPKLQGIVFDPKRPSAVISGKTLFVGERIGGFRLAAITQESVTLVGGGQTNILTLEQ